MSLREIQRPLKAKYRQEPGAAKITLVARSSQVAAEAMACSVDIGRAIYQAQAHSGVGGIGTAPCSGDLLSGALAACTQITVQMVADAMGLSLDSIEVVVAGDLDLRGTLGIDPLTPVGFQSIRCTVHVAGKATDKQLATLREMAEKYCVVMSTLKLPPKLGMNWEIEPAQEQPNGNATKP